MRLFIALPLTQCATKALQRCTDSLAPHLTSGRIVDSDNYHITLSFLGEVSENNLIYIQSAMDAIKAMPAPTLSFVGLGNIRSSEIVCAKLKKSDKLFDLQSALANELEQRGFAVEHRAYRPHVTLIRKYKFDLPFAEAVKYAQLSNMPFQCDEVTLFETIFGSGGVNYRPVYTVKLPSNNV